MKTIKLFNDYGAYPIWIFNEDGELIDNDLPNEIKDFEEAKFLRDQITNEYMKLFVNNEIEFKYIGFKSKNDKENFIALTNKFENYLKKQVESKYIIINELNSNL